MQELMWAASGCHDFPALRPLIPQLVQLLSSQHLPSQQAAVSIVWDMTASDRNHVVQQLATSGCFSALTSLLNGSNHFMLQGASFILENTLSNLPSACDVMFETPQLVQSLVRQIGSRVDAWFSDQDANYLPQTLAACCIHKMLLYDRVGARRVVSAAPGSRKRLTAGAASCYGPLKQECKDILALL